jgi:hypothetical protein
MIKPLLEGFWFTRRHPGMPGLLARGVYVGLSGP